MGLLEALKQYASDAVGGSLNPEVGNTLSGLLNYGKDRAKYIGGLLDDNSQINQDFQNWHKRTQLGLADLIAGKEGPQADYGYSQLMNMAGVAPVGMTAWHGSPHKFDKFSLDKIGTGEGAQAYGHGLYLAESPEVALEYQRALASKNKKAGVVTGGWVTDWLDENTAKLLSSVEGNIDDAISKAITSPLRGGKSQYDIAALNKLKEYGPSFPGYSPEGVLYKTDIPDEAVARFLDWDKPLSQQAPEVRDAVRKLSVSEQEAKFAPDTWRLQWDDRLRGYGAAPQMGGIVPLNTSDKSAAEEAMKKLADDWYKTRGVGVVDELVRTLGGPAKAADALKAQGIPGIRYLDGGSRSAGQGSSNYVVFDPEMIRILERNGQPTGLEPWQPGEYRLGDLLK